MPAKTHPTRNGLPREDAGRRVRPVTAAPVKIVLDLRASERDRVYLEDWIHELLESARGTGALEGSSVLEHGDRRLVLLRFATLADHERWSASPAVASVIEAGDAFVRRKQPVERTGLEPWFALSDTEAVVGAPPKWKMALVTWGALLALIVALSFVIPPSLPFPVGLALSTAIPTCLLTWIGMPVLTRLLRSWLYAPSP